MDGNQRGPIKIIIKQSVMHSGAGSMSLPGGRRIVLSNSKTSNLARENCRSNGTTCSSSSISQRKSQRINEDDHRVAKKSCNSGFCHVVNNYSLIASRGELAENNFTVCDVPLLVKKKPSIFHAKLRRQDSPKRSVVESLRNKYSPVLQRKIFDTDRTRVSPTSRKPISKYHCVTASQQKEGRDKSPTCYIKDSILPRLVKQPLSKKPAENFGFSFLRNSILSAKVKGHPRRSSSLSSTPLNSVLDWNKSTVKKSVSFSSDTSFKERRSNSKRTAVHESKVYKQGVLQDRGTNEKVIKKTPGASGIASGGFKALLRAAREGDDGHLKMIIGRIQKVGLHEANIDINIFDSSGRTAVSYLAGTGSALMLEDVLAFPGINPNIPDNEGNTPLHFAAQAGQTECLNTLLQKCPEIEVDARNILGFTPLMKAALQGRTRCAKILLLAGANPTLRDHGRGLRAEQWARYCGRYVCAEVIEKFARSRLLEKGTSTCRWGSEPELAVKVLQGKVTPCPINPVTPSSTGLKSKIRRVFRSSSSSDRNFSIVSQLTSAALCASSPALPKPGDVPPVVKSLLRPLSVPQLRITLVAPTEILERASSEKCNAAVTDKKDNVSTKPPRTVRKK